MVCSKPDCPAFTCQTEAAKVELATKWKGLQMTADTSQCFNFYIKFHQLIQMAYSEVVVASSTSSAN